ncbi:MAG: aldo/keto reductase [Pseudomonadales bacterium]|jgi:aryl-alcohol dehydrogenase-like predicted oxidoreductase
MHYRPFGTTGLEISALVFGGGAVGGLLIDKPRETQEKALRLALDSGINWIDTAPSYGDGKSEQTLGHLLKDEANPPHISTKFTIDSRDPDIYGQIEHSLNQSLERLGRQKVTLLQLHNPIVARTDGRSLGLSELLKPHGILDILEGFKSQGMIDHFGITALGETAAITRVIKSNRIASAQVYFNLLNPSAAFTPSPAWPYHNFTGIVDTCFEHGVAPMNIRVLSAGVLATNDRHGREMPLTPGDTVESETSKAEYMFEQIGLEHGTQAQTAIRFALAQQRFTCIVVGLANINQLEEAINAEQLGPLSPDALSHITNAYTNYKP